jgi:phosphatidylglycerophosphate synthase
MTTAVLLATDAADHGGPAAELRLGDTTVLERLVSQLARLGVDSVHVITRPEWESALRASSGGAAVTTVQSAPADGEELLLAAANVVMHDEVLRGLLEDPRVSTGALCTTRDMAAPGAREAQGRIVAGNPNVRFLSVLKVAWGDRAVLSKGDADEALASLLEGRAAVTAVQLRELFWARPRSQADADQAAAEMATLDEDRLLLDSAVKANDSFFTTYFVSPYSKYLARWAAGRGWTPNLVTTVSLAIGVLAAIAFATGERAGLIAGALLLQLSFTTDCVDGQLARYTRTFSRLGGWLDAVFDRGKEYVVYAGLAIGASRAGDPVWVLAGAALAIQTIRHTIDFSYLILERERLGAASGGSGSAARAPATWDRLTGGAGATWAKKFIAFPIGERFAAISITAAVASARTTFVVLLAWGGVATAYKLLGRLARSVPR